MLKNMGQVGNNGLTRVLANKVGLPHPELHSPDLPLHEPQVLDHGHHIPHQLGTPTGKQSKIPQEQYEDTPNPISATGSNEGKFDWATIKQEYPVSSFMSVPSSVPRSVPQIQHVFTAETENEKLIRIDRLNQVKGNFTHAWNGYKNHAWLRDEVMPISGTPHDPFGGWAATLVDSLGLYP